MKAKAFKNYTNEEFTWMFDGMEYTFAAGQEIYLEDFKADHFAKHLVDRECNKAGIPTNDPSRKAMESQCFPAAEEVSVGEALNIEEKKKVTKKTKKVEEEFPDLND